MFLIFMFFFTSMITMFICDGDYKENPFEFVLCILGFILSWVCFVATCDIIEVVKVGG